MKLGEMTLEQSKKAEMLIIPEIEAITADKETAALFDALYTGGSKKAEVMRRIDAVRKLTSRLVQNHLDNVCVILGALNSTDPKKVLSQKRSEANKQIAEMLNDPDLVSFFMSPAALAQAAQSAS